MRAITTRLSGRSWGLPNLWSHLGLNRSHRLLVAVAVLAAVWRTLLAGGMSVAAGPSPLSDHAQIDASRRLLRSIQDNDIRFDRISVEQGLSQSTVNCIIQDSAGFLWFGTEDGLNRYDGYNFVVYRHDPEDPESLSNNTIRTLYEDRKGELWIGTGGGGLDRFEQDTGQFKHYRADPQDPQSLSHDVVWSIHEDQYGEFWVGTGAGLDRFDREKGTFAPYDPKNLGDSPVRAIQRDLSGLLWVGTDGGLVAFDPESETFTRYEYDPLDPRSLSNNVVTALLEDEAGVLWIGTSGGGLNKFDRESVGFTRYRYRPRDSRSLSNDFVTSLVQDRAGLLWIGTNGGGLDKFDRDSGTFVHYQNDPGNANSLSSDLVLSVYEDREGVLWVGTNGGSINKSYVGRRNFVHYKVNPGDPNSLSDDIVRALYEDCSGLLWIGTNAGLDRLDRETGQFTHYQNSPVDSHSLSDNYVLSILEDQAGTLWVGTLQGGLNRFDPETGDFTRYRTNPRDPFSLSSNTVRVLYEDSSGDLWVGTNDGLNLFDPQSEVFTQLPYQFRPGMSNALTNNDIRAIHEDRDGFLWVGTVDGLNRLDRVTKQITNYRKVQGDPGSLSNNFVLSIHQDEAGSLWVGTFQGGLNKLDLESGRFVHYRAKGGLPNDVVYGILEEQPPVEGEAPTDVTQLSRETDEVGLILWLSTNQGLSRFDTQTETFKNYDVRDGLQSNEFNGGAYHQSSSGEMFFGGINGFNAFFPELVRENAYVPPVALTSLTQSGEAVRAGRTVERLQEVTIRWPKSFFEFEFAALSYAQPEKNEYAYMLEGFDEGWNEVGTRRFGRYTNLPGKTYTLHVKGSNNDGTWNEEGASLRVSVVPPFWATWWFRGGILLLLVVAVVGGYRLRVRSIEARSRELETLVDQRTAELRREVDQRVRAEEALRQRETEQAIAEERSRLARDLHDAVSQTLFSASLIAEALPGTWERDPEEGRNLLQELRRSTRGVLAEMRTLLLELRPAALLEASLDDLLHQLAEAATAREDLPVSVTVEGDCDLPSDVHIALYRIAQEALNNVSKHARASQAAVSLRCSVPPTASRAPAGGGEERGSVELAIRDDGRGFDPANVPPHHLGLGIMRERAEAVGATFAVESQPGDGTQITVVWLGDPGHGPAEE